MHLVESVDPECADALTLIGELNAALAAITGDSGNASFDVSDVRVPNARFVIARDAQGRAQGCGAFRPLQDGVAEIKRMYARPGTQGVGSAVLSFLEAEAARVGYHTLWLSTRVVNTGAVAFYERRGYVRITNYGKYAGSDLSGCFGKALVGNAALPHH